jgi:hypothetical protein
MLKHKIARPDVGDPGKGPKRRAKREKLCEIPVTECNVRAAREAKSPIHRTIPPLRLLWKGTAQETRMVHGDGAPNDRYERL